jgi:hypothetical protein
MSLSAFDFLRLLFLCLAAPLQGSTRTLPSTWTRWQAMLWCYNGCRRMKTHDIKHTDLFQKELQLDWCASRTTPTIIYWTSETHWLLDYIVSHDAGKRIYRGRQVIGQVAEWIFIIPIFKSPANDIQDNITYSELPLQTPLNLRCANECAIAPLETHALRIR